MNAITTLPAHRTCTAPEGVACMGGCGFLITPGRAIWPGRLCELCHHDLQERPKAMREDFRVTYLREQLRAASKARIDRDRMMRACWAGVGLGLIASAFLHIAGLG